MQNLDNEKDKTDISLLALKYLETATENMEAWLDLLHEDIVIEFPYAESADLPHQIAGKELIRKSTESFLASVPGIRFNNPAVFACLNPHQAFATYQVSVRVPATNKEYNQSYIAEFIEKEGKIISMREYYDPVRLLTAFN